MICLLEVCLSGLWILFPVQLASIAPRPDFTSCCASHTHTHTHTFLLWLVQQNMWQRRGEPYCLLPDLLYMQIWHSFQKIHMYTVLPTFQTQLYLASRGKQQGLHSISCQDYQRHAQHAKRMEKECQSSAPLHRSRHPAVWTRSCPLM